MPLTAKDIKEAEALEEELRGGLEDASSPDYDDNASTYNQLSRAIDDYYKGQRKTDASGRLTAPPATRSAAEVRGNPQSKQFDYHFEPSVSEVRSLLQNSPELIKQYGLQSWLQPGATPEMSMQMPNDAGYSVGVNTQEPKTFLDSMTADSSPYKTIAEHMWRQKQDQANASGVNLKRYRDIHFKKGQAEDFLKGGLEYNIDRRLAPAAMAGADVMSAGAASPMYDMAVERYNKIGPTRDTQALEDPSALDAPEYTGVTDPMSGAPMGTDEAQLDTYGSQMPTSQEIKDRSPGIYHGTTMAAYSLPVAPANRVQSILTEALGYAEKDAAGKAMRSVPMKAVISGLSGGIANAFEGTVRDTATGIQQGKGLSEIASDVGAGVPVNTGFGFLGGAGGDLVAQGAGAARNSFRRLNQDIRTLYNSGGDTGMWSGTKPSPEVEGYVQAGIRPRSAGSPGALAAEAVAPRIESSLQAQDVANNQRIGKQVEDYFNHPAYRDIKVKGTRLVQALVDMTKQGEFRSPVTGTSANLNPGLVNSVNKELGGAPWAEPRYVPRGESVALAHETGGVIVDTETANKMFGGDEFYPPGYDAVIIPKDFSARDITGMEEKVDRILKMHSDGTAPADPVYEHLNRALKETRDEFPLWEDEAGNLVAPPESTPSQEPFAPAADGSPPEPPPEGGGVSQYPPPVKVGGEAGGIPESRPGVGPNQPVIPGTFDRRSARPQVPDSPLEAMARPIDVGPDDVRRGRPEGLLGVGPENPQLTLPKNPFEALPGPSNSGILAEQLQPNQSLDVQGSYNEPPIIPPEAIPGVGRRRDIGQLTVQGKRPIDVVGGEYAPPRNIEPDKPFELTDMSPTTERMPIGLSEPSSPLQEMAGTSQPEELMSVQPEELMSAEPPAATDLASAIKSATSGNSGLADVAGVVKAMGGDVKAAHKAILEAEQQGLIELRPEGGLNRLSPEELALTIPGPHETQLSKIRVLEPAPKPSRSPLERFIDAELEDGGPREPTERIPPEVPKPPESFSPGREARSAEASRVGDMGDMLQAHDQAEAQVRNIEDRLGKLTEGDRLKSILGIIGNKLGRKVTKEDLIKAGIISAGAAASLSDDEDVQNVGSGAMMLGGLFGKGKEEPPAPKRGPRQPEATLDDGRVVKGFSALRRKQSESKKGIETAMRRVGVNGEKTLRDRLIEFRQGDNKLYDDALEAEAKKLGLSEELWRVPAAAGQLEMERNRALFGGSGKSLIGRIAGAGGPRLDALAGLLSGAGRNPYAKGPEGILEAMARGVLDLSGGRVGARYGDDLSRIYDALNQQFQETKRKLGDEDQEGKK